MKRIIAIVGVWCTVYGVQCRAEAMGDRRQATGEVVYQTRAIGQGIRSLRVESVEEKEKREAGSRTDPTRVYLTLPGEGEIDGTEAANTLSISFDEMSHNIKQYAYTVAHLSADFKKDDLQSFEYVRGFTRSDIVDYTTSLNTAINYTHYAFNFPNDDMHLLVSGNYLLSIYDTEIGEEHPVATVVFQVVEPIASISASVTANTVKELSGRYQQVNIEVGTGAVNMVNPTDVKLLVRQNGRLDNQVYAPYPNYIEVNKLRWKDNKQLVWEGGNEYRHMDIWSTYFAGYNVDRIRYEQGEYHAYLMPDKVKTGSYMHEFDHNGMMTINAERCSDIDSEAEYMYVHWVLPMKDPIFDGTIYIGGDVFSNQMEHSLNRMLYDNESQCYYMTALLKQGGYDYQYWLKKKNEPSATLLMTEGSYWQTENVYTIYVYFRSVSDRYDRLIGIYSSSST